MHDPKVTWRKMTRNDIWHMIIFLSNSSLSHSKECTCVTILASRHHTIRCMICVMKCVSISCHGDTFEGPRASILVVPGPGFATLPSSAEVTAGAPTCNIFCSRGILLICSVDIDTGTWKIYTWIANTLFEGGRQIISVSWNFPHFFWMLP